MSITTKEVIIFDTEVKPNRFLFRARSKKTGHKVALWHHIPGDMEKLRRLLRNDSLIWVGFNSKNFDWPLVTKACSGSGPAAIYALAQEIIENRKPAWMTYRDAGLEAPDVDTIDLIEVAPGVMISLKLYGARMGMQTIFDSPFHHSEELDEWQLDTELAYCDNDIDTTDALFESQREAILMREKMGDKYGIDLRSKSDAQMAEAIIAKKMSLFGKSGTNIPQTVGYKPPPFIQPQSAILRDILLRVTKTRFTVKQSNGAIELPDFLAKETVHIGDGVYQMGIGGLHSKHDRSQWWVSTPDLLVEDWDVESFYPNLLLEGGFVPAGLGKEFIELYRGFLTERLDAKHLVQQLSKKPDLTPTEKKVLAAAKAENDGGKVKLNGSFGKLGSLFSKIYSPDLMLAITLSGQFYLLTLIDHLQVFGVHVVSANTDGICIAGTPYAMQEAGEFIKLYGFLTGFAFEQTKYKSIALKDVNNYVAVTTAGKVKSKGLYAESGLMKNPTNEICSAAVRAFFATDAQPRDYIMWAIQDPDLFPQFLQARTVNGGAVQNGVNVGRVARWYYSTDKTLTINYATNGNLVPRSTGGRLCMEIPNPPPTDIDVARYIEEAVSHLNDMGVKI